MSDGPNIWALTAVVVLSLFSFGVFMNDEGAQLEGIYRLRTGDDSGEHQPQFYAVAEGILLPAWEKNVQSPLVTVSGVAMYYPVKALDFAIPILHFLIGAWGAALYVTMKTTIRSPWYSEPSANRSLKWKLAHTTFEHRLVLGGSLVATVLLWIGAPQIDYAVWGELVAVQVAHALLFVVSAVLFRDLVRVHFDDEKLGWIGWGMFILSPLLFWGIGVKYHAMSIFLLVAAMWLLNRQDVWRYAAIVVALVGVANTPLAAPFMMAATAVLLVEAWREHKNRKPFMVAAAILAGSAFVFFWYNLAIWGTLAGRKGPTLDDLNSWSTVTAYLADKLRFESWGTSLGNVVKLFFYSDSFEGRPLGLVAISPWLALAFAAPSVMTRQRSWSLQTKIACLHVPLFLLLFMHALHTQGSGADNRFALILLPSLFLLSLTVAKKPLAGVKESDLMNAAAGLLAFFVATIVMLALFARADIVITAGRPALQVRSFANWIGLWAAILVAATWVKPGLARITGWRPYVGSMVVGAPLLWLVHTMILFRRSLPPWPFGTGAETIEFVLPHWVDVRLWLIRELFSL